MDFKRIFLTLALCINFRIFQSEFVDILLEINDFNPSNYTRFINVTHQQFLWLSSVLCDNNTYSYSITYDRDNGAVVSYGSTTFMAQKVDTAIFLKEFICTPSSTVFQCTRRQSNQNCDDNKIPWVYHSTDTSSTCADKCVTMCPLDPIQSIILIKNDTQTFKIPNDTECQNEVPHQTSTFKSSDPSASNQRTTSTLNSKITFMSTYSLPSSPDNSKKTPSDDSLHVIIGASVGGGIFIIIVIIGFFVCLKKRQKRNQLKNPQQKEYNCDSAKDNGFKTKTQHNHTDEGDHKTYVTELAKAKSVNKLTETIDVTESCGSINVKVNIATYSCFENDAIEAIEKDYNVSKINRNQRQFQQSEFSNPAFTGSGIDYSSIYEVDNEIKKNTNNDDCSYTSEPFHNSGNTYSTLGEKTRSVSDTYNVVPIVSNKKGHKSLGAISDYRNSKGNASNEILGDNVWQVDSAHNDVYAQVIKPMRK